MDLAHCILRVVQPASVVNKRAEMDPVQLKFCEDHTDQICQKYNPILPSANSGNGPNAADFDRSTTGL